MQNESDYGVVLIGKILSAIYKLPAKVLILFVRFWQKLISPLYGDICRFEPSCSAYFIQAVEKYGAVWGSLKGLWRICRCNPFNPGGDDPP